MKKGDTKQQGSSKHQAPTLVMSHENLDDAQDDQEEKNYQGKEAVAGDTFFVTQRPESLDSARSQITDELGIGGRRPAKLVADPAQQRGQIVFAHA